jgi:hypothetical protein
MKTVKPHLSENLKKIHEGLLEAHRRMIEEKRRKGEQIAIMQNGKVVLINP